MKRKPAKGDLRRNKLHIPHPVRRLRRTGVVRSVVPPFPTRIASLDSRGSPVPFANPLKTTKKGAAAPFLGFSPGLGLCRGYFKSTKRTTDAYWIDRRGHRNTLRLFRMHLVRQSVYARYTAQSLQGGSLSNSIRQIFNGREQNDLYGMLCAREAQLGGRPKGVWTTDGVTTTRTT